MKQSISLKFPKGTKLAGRNSKTLVSVLTGCSTKNDFESQIEKIEAINNLPIIERPDIISDLSINKSGSILYKKILSAFPDFIVSTLPIYQCKPINGEIDPVQLFEIVQEQMECGVGFITIHPTPNSETIHLAKKRRVPWTSRGGAMVIKDFIKKNLKEENVYLKILDKIITIAKEKDVVISIGASFRSANIFDSLDDCQINEINIQKTIGDYIASKGVGVIVEGPGHCPPKKLAQVAKYYQLMGFPIMPLGPIPTDTAIGQDHIASSIGAAILGLYDCVDIITSVTREEHTGGIPSIASSIEAIQASKITGHIIDLNKIDDYLLDDNIVSFRAKYKTCVYGKTNSGCSRCVDVCPLRFEN